MSKSNGHSNGPELKTLIVRIIAGFLGFMMIFSIIVVAVQSYANMATDLKVGDEIDVGLYYGSELAESFTADASKGFRIEIPCGESFLSFDDADGVKSVSIANGENLSKTEYSFTRAEEGAGVSVGGYRVMLSSYSTKVGANSKNDNIILFRPTGETTGTFNADNIRAYIERISDTVKRLDSYAAPAYIDGQYFICLGGFASAELAENFLDAFKVSYNCEASIIEPDKNVYSVIDHKTGTLLCHFSGIDSLYLTPVANENFTSLTGGTYFGRLRFENKGGEFQIINTLYMEQYVASRLSTEVDTSWNAEALKAVATVIRTNAYGSLDADSPHKNENFDLCSTAHCGVYHGCGSVDDNAINAVDATKNTVIKSDGKLINALYGSTYGGATISLADAYGEGMSEKGKYLVEVLSAWEDFEDRSGGRWTAEINPSELYDLLSNRISDCPLRGNVKEINTVKRSESGVYVTEIEFVDIFDNKLTVKGSEVIRNILTGFVKSAAFSVGIAGDEVSEITLHYNSDTKETVSSETKLTLSGAYGNFVFVGRGQGSGLGMSLNGVNDLVNKGYSYENAYVDIIKTYYKDVSVETLVTDEGAV
ncbi:MAG: SpoIID/LytB domain-containing protein [Ruminococcaceae bacterium]|nr:SpoIID/LytB domain-containing protein [Oscillospiraceae bacterium]